MLYARRYNMSREDRLEFAEILLRRDVTSWKNLDEAQFCRLLDAMEGYALITHMRWSKGERSHGEGVDSGPSVAADDSVSGEPVGSLEPGDEILGLLSEPSVGDDVVEQLGAQHALEVGHQV